MRITTPIFALGIAILGLLAASARATPPEKNTLTADQELTLRIQTVLSTDSVLRSRNLIVSVVDGVAVIGGPLSSSAESEHLNQILKVVPGLSAVKLSVWIPEIEDPLRKQIADRLNGVTPQRPVSIPTPITPIPNRLVSKEPATAAKVRIERYEPPVPMMALLLDPKPNAITRPKVIDSAYSPLPAPIPAAPAGPPQYPTIPPPAVPVVPGQDLDSAIEAVRKGDARFRDLTTQHQAGMITVGGSVTEFDDVWEFIRQVRKVPGVDRVVMGQLNIR